MARRRAELFLAVLQCVLELGSAAHMGRGRSADAVVSEGPGLLRLLGQMDIL